MTFLHSPMLLGDILSSTIWILIPIGIAMTFALMLILSLSVAGAKPESAARGITCMILMMAALSITAFGATQLLYALMIGVFLDTTMLGLYLLLFVVGIGLLVHESRTLGRLDAASSLAPRLVLSHTVECIGILVTIGSLLTLLIRALMTQSLIGWQMPATFALLGGLAALITSVHLSRSATTTKSPSVKATTRKK